MFDNFLSLSMAWALLCFLLPHSPLVSADDRNLTDHKPPVYCKIDLFGTPNIDDCKAAMGQIPYFAQPKGRRDINDATTFRQFAEPQYLKPPFKAVMNPFAPLAIEQLPKIWKLV